MHEELIDAARTAGAWLEARGWRLATAESCTGGLIAAAITEIAGASAWFDRGFVTYSNESKQELLGVAANTLVAHGAVSEETVREMALGALARSQADISIAISGIAGPGGGSTAKPVGTVCFAWAERCNTLSEVSVQTMLFEGDRADVRRKATLFALRNVTKRA